MFGQLLIQHVALDHAATHAVYPNATAVQLHFQRTRYSIADLIILRIVGQDARGAHAGDRDYAAARRHHRNAADVADQIGVHQVLPVVLVQLEDRLEQTVFRIPQQ